MLLVIFIGDKLIFMTLNYLYENTTVGQEGGELNNYLNNSKTIELVLLGSSTTKLQVDPQDFHFSAINLAHHSTSLLYQSAILDIIISKNKIPKAILLAVSPADFTLLPGDKVNQLQKEILFLKYYYNQSAIVKQNINNIALTERLKYILWSYRFNGIIINDLRYYMLSRKNTNSTKANFKYQQSSPDDSLKVVKLMDEFSKKNEVEVRRPNTLPAASLINIIQICKKYNIKLLCFNMAMLLDKPQVIANGTQVVDSLLNTYKIPYFKITNESAPFLFQNKSYWVDLQHLNEKGGKIETQLLVKFVKDSLF